MQLINLSKLKLLVGFVSLIFFATIFIYFINVRSSAKNTVVYLKEKQVILAAEQSNFGLPVRFKTPIINVDAKVEYVGLTPEGLMDVPKDYTNVAWYNLGQRPGENGSAVIAGHYGLKNGEEPAFNNLYKLHQGDKIYIEDDKGAIITFVVREIRSYEPNTDASDIFMSDDSKSHLNLITCEGVWDKISKSYPKRLVVFADKE